MQHAIGTGLFGGMISTTVLAVLLGPVFHSVTVVSVAAWRRMQGGSERVAVEVSIQH